VIGCSERKLTAARSGKKKKGTKAKDPLVLKIPVHTSKKKEGDRPWGTKKVGCFFDGKKSLGKNRQPGHGRLWNVKRREGRRKRG